MGNDDDQLTLAEAAALLGHSPGTLRMQVKAGRLGARLVGKAWVTTLADVERYRRDHLERVGRPRRPGGLEGLLAAIGQDLGEAEADALDLKPMDLTPISPRQSSLPIDSPRPFIVDLRDAAGAASGDHLIMEVKGLEREADRSKDAGAQRWIAAVNHWGKLGRWQYVKLLSPHDLVSVLGDDPGPEADHEARA